MSAAQLLAVEAVGKIYCRDLGRSLRYCLGDIARDVCGVRRTLQLRSHEFQALRDISFSVAPGECVGLVGRNGAGKSTLLKLISGLIKPSTGSIRRNGRLGALIELGAGFIPVLSGRENVFLNGALLGLSPSVVRARFERIVEFAELAEFIDMPLQSYSSGMRARLAFSIAAQLEPQLLLVDEVLSVGDMAFRAKCYRLISELVNAGTAIILVSHNPHTLLAVCARGLWLENGSLQCDAGMPEVLGKYEAEAGQAPISVPAGITGQGRHGDLRIVSAGLTDAGGAPVQALESGEEGVLSVVCDARREIADASFGVIIRAAARWDEPCLSVATRMDGRQFSIPAGRSDLRLRLRPVSLLPGRYTAKISVTEHPFATLDVMESFPFEVRSSRPCGNSMYFQPRSWELA